MPTCVATLRLEHVHSGYWTGLQEFAESLKQNLAYMNLRTACVAEILKSPVLFKVAVNPETTKVTYGGK